MRGDSGFIHYPVANQPKDYYQQEIALCEAKLTGETDPEERKRLETRIRVAKQYITEPNPPFKQ